MLTTSQLLLDPTVLFAGYQVPHPLENDIIIKIQTDERSNPADAFKRACQQLINQTLLIKQQFMDQAKNIEMGMGPDAGIAPNAGRSGVRAYDPYGDGLGRDTGLGGLGGGSGAAAGAEVYDF
jgi:DNA-directed RNA polymerase II subunit RPB11